MCWTSALHFTVTCISVFSSGHFIFFVDFAKLAVTFAVVDRFYWNLVICLQLNVVSLVQNFVKIWRLPELWQEAKGIWWRLLQMTRAHGMQCTLHGSARTARFRLTDRHQNSQNLMHLSLKMYTLVYFFPRHTLYSICIVNHCTYASACCWRLNKTLLQMSVN